MTILVTGANGFVGQHLVSELTTNGSTVVAVGGPGHNSLPAAVDFKILDLASAAAVREIDFKSIDAVIHLAGLAAVGPSFDEPLHYIDANAGIQINLFETALQQQVKPRFLIISSGALYDPKAPLPLDEASAIKPSSPYAVSKMTQEQLANYYINRGFECLIARPFNHIGPGQGKGFIVPDLAEQVVAVANHQVETIKVGNLDARRDYTDVRDIVKAYRLLVERGVSGEIYNVCSGKSVSGHTILETLCQAADITGRPEDDPAKMRPSDIPELRGDHTKLTAATGWQPEISLQTTLTDYLASVSN